LRNAIHSTVIVVGLLAAACGSSRETLGPELPGTTEALEKAATSSLIGPTWRLVSLDGRDAVAGVEVTAVFAADDRVAGSAGCNRYFGRAAAKPVTLEVGLLATTMMHCGADGVMAQEQAYLAALEKAKVYHVAGTRLRLGPSAGAVTLVFERQ
jgi:heat shock protein HslJ